MPILIKIILIVAFFSLPFLVYWLYFQAIEKRVQRIIGDNWGPSSIMFKDLRVWFKNFDFLKRKNKFETDPFHTLYSFNDCDIILNKDHFWVIGKTRLIGISRNLMPTKFSFNQSTSKQKYRQVTVEKVIEAGKDLEIEFKDDSYTNPMILVIKRADSKLIAGIQKHFKND
ncbi:MAG: hypothetical protein R3B93_11705 [Bacteroidia bacterium]